MERFLKKSLFYIFTVITFIVSGCASVGELSAKRVFLDSTTHEDDPPEWALSTKIAWKEGDKNFFKKSYTVRGDERVNGCFTLARLDAKESIVTEIANDIRGQIDNAEQTLSEEAEIVLGKVRSEKFEGRITGLRFAHEYFERYKVGGEEKINCYVLAILSQQDYDAIKKKIVHRLMAVDPRIKEAIMKRQISFFSEESQKP